MAFLFDTHVHTDESSSCGKIAAQDVVKRYRDLGYDGICITDHMNRGNLKKRGETYCEKAEAFLKGYRAAKDAAGEDFKIILGMEIRFADHDNDYLVFGFDEQFVFGTDLSGFGSLEEFRPFADENGLVVFQAHPFREDMTIIDWNLLDGIEVYNGHAGHDSSNEIALAWAKKRNLRMSSGSDFHYETGMEPGGILLEKMPADSFEFAQMLLNNRYTLKIGG